LHSFWFINKVGTIYKLKIHLKLLTFSKILCHNQMH
jgi:hypothetical protein